jgi:hypothetical protein
VTSGKVRFVSSDEISPSVASINASTQLSSGFLYGLHSKIKINNEHTK